MIPAQATLWGKAAVATAFDLRKRASAGARDLGRASLIGWGRTRAGIARATAATRATLGRAASRTHAAALHVTASVVEHRHGTWLVLFAVLFTLLWLLAGWIGMDNGVWRGVLVGTITPLLIGRLFPLKRRVR